MMCRAYRTTRSADCIRWCGRRQKERWPALLRLAQNKKSQRSSLLIFERVVDTGIGETLEAQAARIAQTARPALGIGVVATVRETKIHAQIERQLDDTGLG